VALGLTFDSIFCLLAMTNHDVIFFALINLNRGQQMNDSASKFIVILAVALAFGFVMNVSSANAQNYIFNYGKKLPNGKTCRIVFGETHWHAGNHTDASRKKAVAGAIDGWSSFVVFEYGRRWGNWAAADKRSMKCIKDTDAGVWRCRAEAQPCLR
jgi:hypothetical protein